MSHSQLTYFKVGHNTSCFKIMLKALNPKKKLFRFQGEFSLWGHASANFAFTSLQRKSKL